MIESAKACKPESFGTTRTTPIQLVLVFFIAYYIVPTLHNFFILDLHIYNIYTFKEDMQTI